MVSAAPLIKYLLWDNGIEQSSGGVKLRTESGTSQWYKESICIWKRSSSKILIREKHDSNKMHERERERNRGRAAQWSNQITSFNLLIHLSVRVNTSLCDFAWQLRLQPLRRSCSSTLSTSHSQRFCVSISNRFRNQSAAFTDKVAGGARGVELCDWSAVMPCDICRPPFIFSRLFTNTFYGLFSQWTHGSGWFR